MHFSDTKDSFHKKNLWVHSTDLRIYVALKKKNSHQIRSQICTCHDSSAVMTCANLWLDQIIQINIRMKMISTRFQLWAHEIFADVSMGYYINHGWTNIHADTVAFGKPRWRPASIKLWSLLLLWVQAWRIPGLGNVGGVGRESGGSRVDNWDEYLNYGILSWYIWVRSRNCGCLVTWFCY